MAPVFYIVIGFLIILVSTTLGSAAVFFFHRKAISPRTNQVFVGFAAGIMLAASVFSLILPSLESEVAYMPPIAVVVLGFLLGVFFLYGLDRLVPHLHSKVGKEEGIRNTHLKKTTKMFLAVTLHNIPEGLSVGISFGVALASASSTGDPLILMSALALAIGIGLQNVPEGAVVSLAMRNEMPSKKAFLYGAFSGAVEPLAGIAGLLLAYYVTPLLPWALSFAAGSMVYVIIEDMVPDAREEHDNHCGMFAFIAGFLLMMVLDVVLG